MDWSCNTSDWCVERKATCNRGRKVLSRRRNDVRGRAISITYRTLALYPINDWSYNSSIRHSHFVRRQSCSHDRSSLHAMFNIIVGGQLRFSSSGSLEKTHNPLDCIPYINKPSARYQYPYKFHKLDHNHLDKPIFQLSQLTTSTSRRSQQLCPKP